AVDLSIHYTSSLDHSACTCSYQFGCHSCNPRLLGYPAIVPPRQQPAPRPLPPINSWGINGWRRQGFRSIVRSSLRKGILRFIHASLVGSKYSLRRASSG
ncbi:hypothetical protein Vretimale_900, partial [Volvox reticuliferus]